jgi:hypothetical protein
MQTRKLFAVLAVSVLLTACATDPHPMNMTQMIENAKTSADHEALAKHYEEAAKDMQAKVEEHKQWFVQYQTKSYLYGKQAEAMKNHCQSLISSYQQAAEANLKMAADHRQMAAEVK